MKCRERLDLLSFKSKVDFILMPWPPGQTKQKTGGRKCGTPNKRTLGFQSSIEAKLGKSLSESLLEDIVAIEDPVQRARLKMDLLPYIYPRRKAVEIGLEADREDPNQSEVEELVLWLENLDGF